MKPPVPEPVTLKLSYKEARDKKKKEQQFANPVEKERYFSAMKALIKQKIDKKKLSIPNLCSCGSLAENV